MHLIPRLALLSAALMLMGFGCNPFRSVEEKVSQKIGEKVAEGVVSGVTGGKVKMDADGGQVTFKSDEGDGGTVVFGEDVKIPSDFPKDVPMYPGAKAQAVVVGKAGDGATLTLKTDDDAKKVVEWYASETTKAGWEQESTFAANDLELRTYAKGDAKLTLSVSKASEGEKGSVISLVRSEK